MNIKLKIIKIQLELLRSILHFLLNYKNPTDKIVIFYSQKLDEVIVIYHNLKYTSDKFALTNNRALLDKPLTSFLKALTLQYISTDKD